MKQNAIYLLKGLVFSSLIFSVVFFLLAFFMFKNGWGEAILLPLIYVTVCLSSFLGGFYFARHAAAKRFVWGLIFGSAFFLVFLLFLLLSRNPAEITVDRIFTYLAFFLISGMAGGMLS